MQHRWEESYTFDLKRVVFTCKRCKRHLTINKSDCHFLIPPDEELEDAKIDPDCDVEQVRHVMQS